MINVIYKTSIPARVFIWALEVCTIFALWWVLGLFAYNEHSREMIRNFDLNRNAILWVIAVAVPTFTLVLVIIFLSRITAKQIVSNDSKVYFITQFGQEKMVNQIFMLKFLNKILYPDMPIKLIYAKGYGFVMLPISILNNKAISRLQQSSPPPR